MALKDFASYKRLATRDEIAAQLTHDAIDEIEALRKGREDEPHSPQEQEILKRLGVLMTGPRRHAVIPVVRKRWPQMASLLDRKVGVVDGTYILTPEGKAYSFVLQPGEAIPAEARVTFLPTDDGMARNIQVIDGV